MGYLLHCGHTRNDFNELGGDLGLTGLVVLESERTQHFLGVLGRVLHGLHTRGLLRGAVLNVHTEERGGQAEFVEVAENHKQDNNTRRN